jgi:micrococcal nuclease
MPRLSSYVWLAVAAAVCAAPASADVVLPGPVPAAVDEVVDGDTLRVRARIWPGHEVATLVRLEGIDAPERRARCAEERAAAAAARARLAELVADGEVVLLEVRDDKFGGRVRARVLASDGTDVGATLVAARLARPYDGRTRASWCAEAAVSPPPVPAGG